jgi:hypothetical protein
MEIWNRELMDQFENLELSYNIYREEIEDDLWDYLLAGAALEAVLLRGPDLGEPNDRSIFFQVAGFVLRNPMESWSWPHRAG